MPTDTDEGLGNGIAAHDEGGAPSASSADARRGPGGHTVDSHPDDGKATGLRFFPLPTPPLATFRGGARYFGAPRAGGNRLHAACDLLAPYGTPIRAIADGTVIQAPYYFYTGTNALEVNHPGIGVVRYGEISIQKSVHLRAGDRVRAGEVIAYVGRLDSGSSMLHFELYSGTARGELTVPGRRPYQRRQDLVNPSNLVDALSRASFGHAV